MSLKKVKKKKTRINLLIKLGLISQTHNLLSSGPNLNQETQFHVK